MKHLILIKTIVLLLNYLSLGLNAKELEKVWELDQFLMPESAVYDPESEYIYVSNINQNPLEVDGNGSIARVRLDGSELEVEWVKGLSSPKGLDVFDGKLFVADVKELVVIDIQSGQIAARYPLKNARVLNGIDVHQGRVYVSDWLDNKIYTLAGHQLELWYTGPELNHPNGLFVRGKYLYVNAWGNNIQDDFSTTETGGLNRIHLVDKTFQEITEEHEWMNLDGLHKSKKHSWLVTDFIKGQLLKIGKSGRVLKRYDLEPTAADFFYLEGQGLIIVPFLMLNKIALYRFQ